MNNQNLINILLVALFVVILGSCYNHFLKDDKVADENLAVTQTEAPQTQELEQEQAQESETPDLKAPEVNSKGKKVTRTDIHTHMLRGTFATRCAEAKIAPVVLKEILGHSDISITMKYYVDIDTDFIKSENKSVVNYLINKNIFGAIMNKQIVAS